MFYTRIPVPHKVKYTAENLNEATRYFPLIGYVSALLSTLIIYFTKDVFGHEIAIVLSMVSTVLLTGGFHEDGFADTCDGFGGGWSKQKILDIMKDSRLGTYGALGLFFLLILKFLLLNQVLNANHGVFSLFFSLMASQALSRSIAASFIFTHEYSRDDETSKSKPVAKKLSVNNLIVVMIIGLIPIYFLMMDGLRFYILAIPIVAYVVKILLARYFVKWIDGYTGDCLGATQQVTEVVILLCLVAVNSCCV